MRIAYPTYAALLLVACFFGLLLWLDTPAAYTQTEPPTLHQLTNQHTGIVSSYPSGFTELNGAVYFGTRGTKGGLWQTDGTSQGTVLIKDVAIVPSSLQRIGAQLYFGVYNDSYDITLWHSDGTAEGTQPIREDLAVYPLHVVQLNNRLYFAADDGAHGMELWQSDGTAAGTTLVADLNPGQANSYPAALSVLNNKLYFTGYDEQFDIRLWQSDGTAAGTQAVTTLPGTIQRLTGLQNAFYFLQYEYFSSDYTLWRYAIGDPEPKPVVGPGAVKGNNLVVVKDRLYFVAQGPGIGSQLWQTDGTTTAAQIVTDLAPGAVGATIDHLTGVNDRLYFATYEVNGLAALWQSDGTAAGTIRIKDLASGMSSTRLAEFTAMNGQLYFLSRLAQPEGSIGEFDFWRSDGTAAGTFAFTKIRRTDYYNSPLVAIGAKLYFSALDDAHGEELWVTDGTSAGTAFIKDLDTNYSGLEFSNFMPVNQRLYFTTVTGDYFSGWSEKLWMSENATKPAIPIDTPPNFAGEYGSYQLYQVGDSLLVASYSGGQNGLWKHEGNGSTPVLLKSFNRSGPANAIALGNQLIFLADDDKLAPSQYDLWRSDGTITGTIKVLNSTITDTVPYLRQSFNDRVIGTRNNELLLTDGTIPGTTHFVPNGLQGTIVYLATTTDAVYFTASQTGDGFTTTTTVWRSDGTPQGTHQLNFAPATFYASALVPVGNTIYLMGSSPGGYEEIWYNDGVTPTFNRLAGLTPTTYYNMSWLTPANGQLFFTADDGTHGPELWKSNGTPEGTMLVKDIIPAELANVPSAYPGPLFAFGDLLYFSINDGQHGQELWRSDGSPDGTQLFKDIKPNAGSSRPENFISRPGLFFFSADDGVHGRELWQSDGTVDGTRLQTDLYPGAASATPYNAMMADNILYFTGNNGLDGRQLFSLQTTVIPLAIPVADEPPAPHHLYLPLVR